MDLAEEAGVEVDGLERHFIEDLPQHPLVLRAASQRQGGEKHKGATLKVEPTAKSKAIEAQVREINEFLDTFDRDVAGPDYESASDKVGVTTGAGLAAKRLLSGIVNRGAVRQEITNAAGGVKLSKDGQSRIGSFVKRMNAVNEGSGNSTRVTARQGVENTIAEAGFNAKDAKALKAHFENATTAKGEKFYNEGWGFKDDAAKAAHERVTASKARERATKAAKRAKS